jgi:hypothetical protein
MQEALNNVLKKHGIVVQEIRFDRHQNFGIRFNQKSEAVIKYAMQIVKSLNKIGISGFEMTRDYDLVKIIIKGLPLSIARGVWGGNWDPTDWNHESCKKLKAEIEKSNPGVEVKTNPHWTGTMRGLQGRKVKTAGLVTIISLNTPGKKMIEDHKCYMYAKELTCERFVQRYSQQTCGNCLTLGHNNTTCRDRVRCRYCFGNHLSTYHPKCGKCTNSKKGTPCSHTIVRCPNCDEKTHFAGDPKCKGQAPNTSFERKKFYTHDPEEMEKAQ